MSNKKLNLENLIRAYLLDEGILREKIHGTEFDFGFVFSFPPGPKGQNMSVIKLKNRNFIQIVIRIQLSKKHINKLNSLKDDKKIQFFSDVRKYFIIRQVYFKIDPNNFIFEIIEQIFPDRTGYISQSNFFTAIQKVFYCFLFSNLLLEEYCFGKEISSKKLHSDFDLSLYS